MLPEGFSAASRVRPGGGEYRRLFGGGQWVCILVSKSWARMMLCFELSPDLVARAPAWLDHTSPAHATHAGETKLIPTMCRQ